MYDNQKLEFEQIAEQISEDSSGSKISMHEIVEALNSRGFGAMLTGVALFSLLPISIIPGISSACAVVIILICGQMLVGRAHPWIPKRIRELSFERSKYEDKKQTIMPYIKWFDRLFEPRLLFLKHPFFKRVIAVVCIALACGLIITEFIPLIGILPAVNILLYGLGVSTRDGAVIILGFAMTSTITGLLIYLPNVLQF